MDDIGGLLVGLPAGCGPRCRRKSCCSRLGHAAAAGAAARYLAARAARRAMPRRRTSFFGGRFPIAVASSCLTRKIWPGRERRSSGERAGQGLGLCSPGPGTNAQFLPGRGYRHYQRALIILRGQLEWLDDLDPMIVTLMGMAEALASAGNREEAQEAYREFSRSRRATSPIPVKCRVISRSFRGSPPADFQSAYRESGHNHRSPGAEVTLDCLSAGKTPLQKKDLPPGIHP